AAAPRCSQRCRLRVIHASRALALAPTEQISPSSEGGILTAATVVVTPAVPDLAVLRTEESPLTHGSWVPPPPPPTPWRWGGLRGPGQCLPCSAAVHRAVCHRG